MFRFPPAMLFQRLERYQPRPFVDLGAALSEALSGRIDRFLLRFRLKRVEKQRMVVPAAPVSNPVSDTARVPMVVVSTPDVSPSQSAVPPGGVIAWSDVDFVMSVEVVPGSGTDVPARALVYEGLTRSVTTRATKSARKKDVRLHSSAGKMAASSSRDGMRLSASHSTRPKRKNASANVQRTKVETPPLELNEALYQRVTFEAIRQFRADRVENPRSVMAEILKMETGQAEIDVQDLVERHVLECLRAGVEEKRAQDINVDKGLLRKMANRARGKIVGRAWTLLKDAKMVDENDPLQNRARRRHWKDHGEAETVYLSRLGDAGALCFIIAQEGHKQLIRGVTALDNISRWLPTA